MESNHPSSLVIREAGFADVPAITRIFNDAIVNTTAVYFYDPVTEQKPGGVALGQAPLEG